MVQRYKLRDLEPKLLRYAAGRHPCVQSLAEAQGVRFLCPKCFETNGGAAGTHGVICWSSSRGVPDDAHPRPGRWRLVGTSLDDLSLMEEPGKSRSVLLVGGCAWHGFVTNGDVHD